MAGSLRTLRRSGPYAATGVAAGVAIALGVRAGPLSPPAGPVSPTYKTLGEIEPRISVQSLAGSGSAVYVISAPGSYYLAGPVTGVVGRSGIVIDAPNVTLDLRGYTLSGVTGAVSGITATTAASELHIVGGMARGWPIAGFDLSAAGPVRAEGLIAAACGTGILAGAYATISDCTADSNVSGGIATGIHARVLSCSATSNGSDGFYLSDGCTLDGCLAAGNGSDGAYLDGDGCTVRNCTFRLSGARGLVSIYTATIESCTAEFNAAAGFEAQGACRIRGCTAAGNDGGGYRAQDGTEIERSAARANTGFGVQVRSRCRVESCDIADTHAAAPAAGAGVLATGSDNQIEANVLALNDVGVRTQGPGNLIVKNSASGNGTAFDLSPGQFAGQILADPIAAPSAGAWANFVR